MEFSQRECALYDSVRSVWTDRYREVRGYRGVVIRFSKRCVVCFVMKNSFEEFRMENDKFSCSHMINRHMRISLHYKL